MRSQAFIRRSRSLLKGSRAPISRPLFSAVSRPSRNDSVLPTSIYGKRLSSSSTPASASEPPPLESPTDDLDVTPSASNSPESPPPDPEKPKAKKPRAAREPEKKDPDVPLELPENLALGILWRPEAESDSSPSNQAALPPPEIFDEVLHNLHITLHPQTQHRATCMSHSSAYLCA